MKLRRRLLPTLMLVVAAIAFTFSATVDVAPNYVAVTPALIVALVVCGWLIPRKD